LVRLFVPLFAFDLRCLLHRLIQLPRLLYLHWFCGCSAVAFVPFAVRSAFWVCSAYVYYVAVRYRCCSFICSLRCVRCVHVGATFVYVVHFTLRSLYFVVLVFCSTFVCCVRSFRHVDLLPFTCRFCSVCVCYCCPLHSRYVRSPTFTFAMRYRYAFRFPGAFTFVPDVVARVAALALVVRRVHGAFVLCGCVMVVVARWLVYPTLRYRLPFHVAVRAGATCSRSFWTCVFTVAFVCFRCFRSCVYHLITVLVLVVRPWNVTFTLPVCYRADLRCSFVFRCGCLHSLFAIRCYRCRFLVVWFVRFVMLVALLLPLRGRYGLRVYVTCVSVAFWFGLPFYLRVLRVPLRCSFPLFVRCYVLPCCTVRSYPLRCCVLLRSGCGGSFVRSAFVVTVLPVCVRYVYSRLFGCVYWFLLRLRSVCSSGSPATFVWLRSALILLFAVGYVHALFARSFCVRCVLRCSSRSAGFGLDGLLVCGSRSALFTAYVAF